MLRDNRIELFSRGHGNRAAGALTEVEKNICRGLNISEQSFGAHKPRPRIVYASAEEIRTAEIVRGVRERSHRNNIGLAEVFIPLFEE
jgi:hypothetical protein